MPRSGSGTKRKRTRPRAVAAVEPVVEHLLELQALRGPRLPRRLLREPRLRRPDAADVAARPPLALRQRRAHRLHSPDRVDEAEPAAARRIGQPLWN